MYTIYNVQCTLYNEQLNIVYNIYIIYNIQCKIFAINALYQLCPAPLECKSK